MGLGAETLGEVFGFLMVRLNCMVLVDMRVVLDFHELVLESSSLDEKKLSFIFDLFFRFFDFMLVLEVIF